MTEKAIEHLQGVIDEMDGADERLKNAAQKRPYAESAYSTPAPARVQVRKSTPEDDADRAAAALANYKD